MNQLQKEPISAKIGINAPTTDFDSGHISQSQQTCCFCKFSVGSQTKFLDVMNLS